MTLRTRKKRRDAKRPEVKSVRLTPEAAAIWKLYGKRHNWSQLLSAFIVGRFGKHGMTLEQKLLLIDDLKRGFAVEYRNRIDTLHGELAYIIDELDAEAREVRKEIAGQQARVPTLTITEDDER